MTAKNYTTDRLAAPARVTTYDSQAPLNSDVIATAPSFLFKFLAISKAASGTLWLQFFDATAVPNNGAVPFFAPIPIVGGTSVQVDFTPTTEGLIGLSTATGLCWAASSTPATLTVDTTSSVWVTARYMT
jgi:hypothetical protein